MVSKSGPEADADESGGSDVGVESVSPFADVDFNLAIDLLAPTIEQSGRRLTPRQRRRLTSLLRATLEELDARGYEGFGMRDLAPTGVATATIYRFFESREFLIFRATGAWFDWTAQRSLPPSGHGDFRSSSIYQFEHLTSHWAAHPHLVEAWVRASSSDDALVRRLQRTPALSPLAAADWAGMAEFDSDYAERLRSMIQVHAIGGMVQWVHGVRSLEELRDDFDSLLSLVFDPVLLSGETS